MLKPLTCMPGIYGEADTDLGGSGVDKMDRSWPIAVLGGGHLSQRIISDAACDEL